MMLWMDIKDQRTEQVVFSRENLRKDAELHQLLSTSKLLEEYRKYTAYVMVFGYVIDS